IGVVRVPGQNMQQLVLMFPTAEVVACTCTLLPQVTLILPLACMPPVATFSTAQNWAVKLVSDSTVWLGWVVKAMALNALTFTTRCAVAPLLIGQVLVAIIVAWAISVFWTLMLYEAPVPKISLRVIVVPHEGLVIKIG